MKKITIIGAVAIFDFDSPCSIDQDTSSNKRKEI
jgi:hypothetical protein